MGGAGEKREGLQLARVGWGWCGEGGATAGKSWVGLVRRGRGYSWQELGGAGVEREATAGESWVGLVWRGRGYSWQELGGAGEKREGLQLARVGWGCSGAGGYSW